QAEFVEKYLKKGIKVVVTGRIQNDNYTNKDGQKVYSVQIMVEELEFAESKSNDKSQEEDSKQMGEPDADGFINISDGIDSSLPFN
ncbi:MAG: single-stranded DNA-binding protein, partial [Peptoanaerobacter stomatis]|uniref:single-stranded DNA-binding protein n=1 Tax=Peptoanaerobacter stomatis TaxID=796937 RepID=UPI003FA139A4